MSQAADIRDITRIERIGKGGCCHASKHAPDRPGAVATSSDLVLVFAGAHSHIRGLGLDDSLEARAVSYSRCALAE